MERETLKDAKRLDQVRKHLFDNRKNLTEDDFKSLITTLAQEVYSYGYIEGWKARHAVHRACSTARVMRMMNDYSEFYEKHTKAVGNIDGTKPILLNQLELFEELFEDWK